MNDAGAQVIILPIGLPRTLISVPQIGLFAYHALFYI